MKTTTRYVYFIKPVGLDGPIKIGNSDCPEGRLKALASWSPWPLEIIGTVPGGLKDEAFLHDCFHDHHSHHEWFRTSYDLRSAIEQVLKAGSVSVVRGILQPKGKIRSRMRTPAQKLQASYTHRIRWALSRLRIDGDEEITYFACPDDVAKILDQWRSGYRRTVPLKIPTDLDLARLEDFLANAETQAIPTKFARFRKKVAA